MGMLTRAKKSLDRDSDIDASLRLLDGVRNSPTVRTPTVPTPAPTSNEDADVATRKYLQEQSKLVDDIYKARLHRQWAKGVREDVLGDKKHHFRGTDDVGLLSELVVQLRTEFHSAGLELASFDLDDPLARVVTKVNGLLFDVLALVVEKHSNAYVWPTGTDASSDRDGRRALVDIIKGCVPVALRESHQEEHAALRYPADTDPQPILAREQRLARDSKATDWTPAEETRKLSLPVQPARPGVLHCGQGLGADGNGEGSLGQERHLCAALQHRVRRPPQQDQRASGFAAAAARDERATGAAAAAAASAAVAAAAAARGAQRGFRVGTHPVPAVGFDRDDQKAKPFCGRRKKAGKGELYHFYRDCPLGGRLSASPALGRGVLMHSHRRGGRGGGACIGHVCPVPAGGG
ncbi:hypothetical protein CYMTET_8607 [Cymbomonas tetramitiformis]|uniref:Uncharacterized protein n=1 Tax=Cymbomonas tetramitiformis TaxID=36881 RepID=A0AAE0LGB4_9CHLO|nr:hypothetical protein CYMTET_8607 [Cymbomonas tetramitiformis]